MLLKQSINLSKIIVIRRTDLWKYNKSKMKAKMFSDCGLTLDEFETNETGNFIWKLCDGKHSIKDIIKALISECDDELDYKQIEKEVLSFIESLYDNNLISFMNNEEINVLLVAPPFPSLYSPEALKSPEFSSPPLGLLYLASVLLQNGISVQILDMHQKALMPEAIIPLLKELNPKIVALTSTTPTFPNALKIAGYTKAYDQNITTIIGGAHASCATTECLKPGWFDYVCIGEGENTLLELSNLILNNNKRATDIKGLAFLDSNNRKTYTDPRGRVSDIDNFPFPSRDKVNLVDYLKPGSMISSRGCPYNCNYCSCSIISGKSCRQHSIEYMIDEIRQLITKYKCRSIDFHDDCFNLNQKRIYKLCEAIENNDLDFSWGCFCRVTNFDYSLAKTMAQHGCNVVQFGVESGNDRILQSINKKASNEQTLDAVKSAVKAGIEQVVCGFIIGHANDTKETIRETIEFGLQLADIGASRLTLSLLTPYPGTDVYEHRDRYGIELISNDWEEYIFSRVVMQTSNLSKEELRELYTEGIIKFLEASRS